jgi:hypothetical protein
LWSAVAEFDPLVQTLTSILSTKSKHVLVLDTIVNNKERYQHVLVITTTQKSIKHRLPSMPPLQQQGLVLVLV